MESKVFFGSLLNSKIDLQGRESDLRQLSYMLDNEKITILCSDFGAGKTSLVESGVLYDEYLNKKNSIAFKFNFSIYKPNSQTLVNQFVSLLNSSVTEPTCLDKVFKDDGSIWYACKKIQFRYKTKKRIYFIFDNFENFFSYPENQRSDFAKLLSDAISGNIPKEFNNQLQKIIVGESEPIFSKEAVSILYDTINVSNLFIIENYAFNYLSLINDYFSGIFKNIIKILPIDFKTNVDENNGFKIPEYNKILNSLDSLQAEKVKFFCKEMIVEGEENPLPIYSRIANLKYGISEQTIDYLIDNKFFNVIVSLDGRIFYVPRNLEIFNSIKLEKYENDDSNVYYAEHEMRRGKVCNLIQNAPTVKSGRRKVVLTVCLAVAMFCMALTFLAFSLKGSAEKNERAARSNMLSAFAFQKLETDPTFSLRLAQEAVKLDTSNAQAYSALLNSFYNTDIFYSIAGKISSDVVSANICNGGKNILAITKNDKNSVLLLNQNGDTIVELPHNQFVTEHIF